jgi:hypothetical protein
LHPFEANTAYYHRINNNGEVLPVLRLAVGVIYPSDRILALIGVRKAVGQVSPYGPIVGQLRQDLFISTLPKSNLDTFGSQVHCANVLRRLP